MFQSKSAHWKWICFTFRTTQRKLSSVKNAEIIIINGKKDIKFENKILNINKNLKIFYAKYKPENIKQFKNKKILAIAGIGNPE